ncbi:hypothetical protein HKX48_003135 [Thoreauomyces humboldtii]|nr:hypothetical protein HKX48_003135 [Thoreauomyces humboldtii]
MPVQSATARKVVLAGKYLSVLRQCDENHALVRLQTGSHQRNDGFAGVSLVWVFRQEELTMYRDATDVYIRSVETLVSVDKESAAEAIRIEEAEKEVLREAHKEKRLSIVAQRKEDLESRRASVVRQKASAQADIDAFLETRRAEKLETARKAAWAEAKREQAEIAAAEARSVIVEEEKTRMLLEHDAKMRNLDKRAELIEWRRRRLALAPCRQKMWMGEASSDVDVIDQGSADFEIEEQKSDHDDESFADESIDFGHALVEDRGGFEPLLSIPGSYVSDRNGGPSLGDAIDEFGDEADQPYLDSTKVSKDLLQEAQALESHVTSPTDSIIPALTPKTNARIMGELNVPFSGPSIMSFPSRNLKETQASAHTKAATSFLSAAPLFEDLSVPVRLSPFWGPRLSIYPTDELQTQHPINNLTDANVSEEDATGPTPVERVIQIQEESIALPSVLEHPSFISEHQNAEAVPLTSEPYPVKDTLSSIATQPGPFSIVLSIESQLQAGETSVLPLECTLQQLTSATLHHRLSAVTGLISRMTLRALWPGLRRHLAALRRFFLLGDARFLNKTVDALFRSHDGLAMDASGGKAWPPTRADVAETLHGIVRDEAEAPWLEFGGRLGGTDPGDLTAYGSLKLHYRVPEPYDTVVTTETISKYQNCFEYLIAIQRTRSALDRVPRSRWWRGRRSFRRLDRDEELDVFGPRPSHSDWSDHEHHCAEQMYWETRAFVTGLLQYAMDTSVEATWTEFWHTIQRAKESGQDGSERLGLADDQGLDRLCRSHNDMLDSILWRLFLAPPLQPIKALLDGLLQTSLRVARTLNGISDVPAFDPVGALHDFHQNMNQLVRLIGTFEERFVPAEAAVDGGGRQRDRPMAETDSLSTLLDHIDVSGFVERNLVKSAQEVV